MKTTFYNLKISVCIFLIIQANLLFDLQAQDYLINFAGEGASTTVSTVKVENLTRGTSLTMNGTDILHLKAVVTGIEPAGEDGSGKIVFYPNPMNDLIKMQFFLPQEGEVLITLYDINGRELAQKKDLLSMGNHSYQMEGISRGTYIVTVTSNKFHLSGTLISSGSLNKMTRIVYEEISLKDKTDDVKGTTAVVEMQYNAGERLKLTAFSGNYSTVITDVPTTGKVITFNFIPCTDGDGNNYPIVQIGTQTWMAENLKATKFNDGTSIDNITDATAWAALYTPAYCIYDNNSSYKDVYGVLYNWFAVQTGKLCPSGWHVFTDDDWKTLEKNIPGDFDANKLKETGTTHWPAPNSSSTNETGFTALPGGHRTNLGSFLALGSNGQFWSSTEYSYTNAWNRGITFEFSEVLRKNNSKICGYSVRCLKD